jgi:hypothetical protein
MDIFTQAAEDSAKRLLNGSQLDSSDLTPEHLERFL